MNAEQFYQDNAQFKPFFPKPPKLSDDELITWIFKQNIPYIELDLEFDIIEWQQESANAYPYLVEHRESQPHKLWRSCTIHGIDVDKTQVWQKYCNTEPEYTWTKLANLTPKIKQFWQSMPFEKLARVRFMEVGSHGYVYPHNDTPPGMPNEFDLLDHIVPINIAIDHPEDCFMTLKEHGIVPWHNGDIKIVNITNDHSVINFSNKSRMHMIGHGYIGNKRKEFTNLIIRSYKKQYERYRI
jgi:hypothetical protein